MLSLFGRKEWGSALRSESAAVVQQACAAAERAAEHAGALGALLSAEVKEYDAHQVQRLVMALVAVVLLLGAYGGLCALLAVLLSCCMGKAGALAVVVVLNLLVALLLLWKVRAMAGKQLAPATVEELKNDWQCLKLLCKENSKP
jgi:uncharacterized membrane protein YqjE